MRRISLIILFTLCGVQLYAQSTPKYVNEFLHLGVGGRSMAMGHTGAATTEDVQSGYWNPAGLMGIRDNIQVALMHSNYYRDIANYDYGAIGTKGKDYALGFSFLRMGVDGILNTLNLFRNGEINYDNVTRFSAVDYAFLMSYAQEGMKNKYRGFDMWYGGSAKIIHRKVGPFANAWGFGLDAGVILKAPRTKGNWRLSLMARDITSTFNSWDMNFTDDQKSVLAATGNTIPANSLEIGLPRFIFGAANTWKSEKLFVTPEFNLTVTTDGKRNTLVRTGLVSFDPCIGAEAGYNLKDQENQIFLRAGVWNFQRETSSKGKVNTITMQPTAGIGIRLKNLYIDYALSSFGSAGASLYSNVVSVRFGINQGN